jgi:NAD-dependent DNA ligase
MQVASVQFTVGKVDAGTALLLSPDHHVVEFPASILPGFLFNSDDTRQGNIVNITIERNLEEETQQQQQFDNLQDEIYSFFSRKPETPVCRLKWITQTTAILEWEQLEYYTADFRSLDVYKNDLKVFSLAATSTSCKLTGLDVAQEYTVRLELRTSAGRHSSNNIAFKTLALEDLTGLHPCFGSFADESDIEALAELVTRIGATYSDDLTFENTHLVCTLPKGPKYDKAVELNIPIVTPEFLKACEQQCKVQPAHLFYTKK